MTPSVAIANIILCASFVGEGRKKSQLGVPASSDYTLGGNDVDMTGIVGKFRTPNGTSEACLLRKLPNGKLGKMHIYFMLISTDTTV